MSSSSARRQNGHGLVHCRRYGARNAHAQSTSSVAEHLKRWVSKTDENGNLGREFFTYLSKKHAGMDGKILKKCGHFEWIETYVQRLEQFQGYNDSLPVDSNGAATRELNFGLPSVGVENLGSSDIGADRDMRRTARNGELPAESELNQELRKIKKHLKEMIDFCRSKEI